MFGRKTTEELTKSAVIAAALLLQNPVIYLNDEDDGIVMRCLKMTARSDEIAMKQGIIFC